MCGIAGILQLNTPCNDSLALIKKMITVLHHRGPDERGIYVDDWVALGHTRLSIIDLLGGTQPIHNEDKSLWIIYNGEVFNYPELRQELIKKGHHFFTSTDTEVILHLYEDKGPDCLSSLNGQFALAIWNSREKSLFLARDRVGIRPLYYTIQKHSLLFASEIKALFMDQNILREIDPRSLHQIFTFWTTLPGKTVFKNIEELPPGCFLKITPHQKTLQKYWEVPFYSPDEQLHEPVETMCEQIRSLMTDAIRIRLRADVPVGCYASGGLDSSIIATLVTHKFNNNVKTFGIRFEEEEFDEGTYQRQMQSFLKTAHTDLVATNAMIGNAFPEVLWYCEKPLLRTAPVPLFLLSQLVNQHNFKVVLTGEGADEVFGGYNIFREAKIRRFWARQPDSKRRGLLIGKLYPYIFTNPRGALMLQSFFAQGLDKADDPLFSHAIRWQNTSKIKELFSEEIRAIANPDDDYEEIKKTFPNSSAAWDYLARAQYLEMMLFLSNYLLSSQGDRMAMGHSLEIRLPFLDYRVIDFMGRVPSQWKIRGLKEKYILKKSFQGILPKEIVGRTKHPYRAPIIKGLLNKETPVEIQAALSDESLQKAGLFDACKVKNFLKKLQRVNNPSERDNMAFVGIVSSQLLFKKFITHFPDEPEKNDPPMFFVDQRKLREYA